MGTHLGLEMNENLRDYVVSKLAENEWIHKSLKDSPNTNTTLVRHYEELNALGKEEVVGRLVDNYYLDFSLRMLGMN